MSARYTDLGYIGDGAFSTVVKARDQETGRNVALKKINLSSYVDEHGYRSGELMALRVLSCLDVDDENDNDESVERSESEASPLSLMSPFSPLSLASSISLPPHFHYHPVVRLFDYFPQSSGGPALVLVCELLENDFASFMRERVREKKPLTVVEVREYAYMMLMGLALCHINSIMHRDVKPSNILLTSDNKLKLADFGLCRLHTEPLAHTPVHADAPAPPLSYQIVIPPSYLDMYAHMNHENQPAPRSLKMPKHGYTNHPATRWYKAPELLLASRSYDLSIDIWSFGCILAELLHPSHEPLLPGESDLDQLSRIMSLLGTPKKTTKEWMDENLPDYDKVEFRELPASDFSVLFPSAPSEAVDLLRSCLKYEPWERITAIQALQHPFFASL